MAVRSARKSELYGDVSKSREKVYALFGTNEDDMKKNIETLRTWCQSQPHLPEVPCDHIIEMLLILAKLSIEKTKTKLDMYYTIRSLLPDFYDESNPKLPRIQRAMDTTMLVPLPTVTQSLHRVIIFKFADSDPEKYEPIPAAMCFFDQYELRFREDFVQGDIIIFDTAGLKLGHVVKITPIYAAKLFAIAEKVFSLRVAAFHVLNANSFVDPIIKLAKTLIKPKLAQRIHVHKTLEGLFEFVPREIMPEDYGGNEKSVKELNETVKRKFVEYQERYDLLDSLRVDESLRPEKLKNDEILGFHGHFKQLSVD